MAPEFYESQYAIDPTLQQEGSTEIAFGRSLDSILSRMGGKRQLKAWLVSRFPRGIQTYVEPFGGSFQVLLHKTWADPIEIINDVDADLVCFFRYLVFDPDRLIGFINSMPTHEAIILGFRRALSDGKLSGLERAAAFYICISSAFNAMVSRGVGRYSSSPHTLVNTNINPDLARRVADRLDRVDIRCTSYDRLLSACIKRIKGGLFVYLDPPYDQTAGYDGFAQGELSFGWEDHQRLAEFCAQIDEVGGRFIQTNSATDRLRDLYGGYKRDDGSPRFSITTRKVYYSVGGVAELREEKDEFIISNYELAADARVERGGRKKVKEMGKQQVNMFGSK